MIHAETFGALWHQQLSRLVHGQAVGPRGMQTRELTGQTLVLEDILQNVLVHPTRSPNYRFMVAEWLWIWFGHDDVATISRYCKNIARFSDDGVRFNGGYGRPIKAQWPAVEVLLLRDRDTRQAVIDVFGGMLSRDSKDVPCTLTIQFLIRHDRLNTIVCMRSSDVWLGLVYDVFVFTMLANIMAARVGALPGRLTLHLGSSHLYERDVEKACAVLDSMLAPMTLASPRFTQAPPLWLEQVLTGYHSLRGLCVLDGKPEQHPWDAYALLLEDVSTKTGPQLILEELVS